jgi:hypothetical protein
MGHGNFDEILNWKSLSDDLIRGFAQNDIFTRLVADMTRQEEWNAINTKEGIRKNLGSLNDFTELVQRRRDYYRKHDIHLDVFYVLDGLFHLDQCGNINTECKSWGDGLVSERIRKNYLPPVLTMLEFHQELDKLGDDTSYSYSHGSDLPPHDLVCPYCGKGWTMLNISDVKFQDSSEGFSLDGRNFSYVGFPVKDVTENFSKTKESPMKKAVSTLIVMLNLQIT